MPTKPHGRKYDLVVFGATGYTGRFAAEYITKSLPTDLNWAIAGRSREKLEKIAAELKSLNTDRRQPDIEISDLDDSELSELAKKTFILISTVGPYGKYGEHAFKACAENGTHYLDVTGEIPFVARMIKKYEKTAKASGSLMFPQIGIESAPPDLITWTLAKHLREELSAKTKDTTVSIHKLTTAPSGGTMASVLGMFDVFSLKEFQDATRPFALSPVPNPNASRKFSIVRTLVGIQNVPHLGVQTTSLAGDTDSAIVQRTWGLLSSTPSRKDEFYGPNFTFTEFMKPKNWFHGIAMHWGLMVAGLFLIIPVARKAVRHFVIQPGQGPDVEQTKTQDLEFRGVALPDPPDSTGKQVYCRAYFTGGMYYLTAMLLAEAAETLLQDDLQLPGGIYTAACMGQRYIDRLEKSGFKFETKIISA